MLLGDILELNALRDPHRLALVCGDESYTFAELRQRAGHLAGAIAELTAPGGRVALLAENLVAYVDAYYGVPGAGRVLVPLNYRLNPHELAGIISDAGAEVLLVEESYLDGMLAVRDEWKCVEQIVVIGAPTAVTGAVSYDDLLATARARSGERPSEDDVAWLLYTSGTTGRPKGAMLTHRSLLTALFNFVMACDVRPDDRALQCFPMCHIAGILVPVHHLAGAPVVLMRAYAPELFMELVERHRITSTGLAPTMMAFLLQHPKIDDYDLSSLRSALYGAAPMPVEVLRAALDRFGPIVYSGFGMTELSGNVLVHPKEAHVRAIHGEEHLLAACGMPMPLAAVRIVDEQLKELAPGLVGEIVIKGEQLLRGYWNRPEATEEAFRGGWFHTGDLARRDEEGFVSIVDRKKDMIITGGENVYSREVEEIIYTHPAVSEAAVIGLPDVDWGEMVTAVVALRAGAHAGERDIMTLCRAHLAGFKTPKRVFFVAELPKTVSGKILKRELRNMFSGDGPPH